MNAKNIDPNKVYLVNGDLLIALMERQVSGVKGQIVAKKEGENFVLGFANEELVYITMNGAAVPVLMPIRTVGDPA